MNQSQVSLHQQLMHSRAQLWTLTHDDATAGGSAVVHLTLQGRLGNVLDGGLEGHSQQGARVVVHPVTVHGLDISTESDVVSNEIEVSVVHRNTVCFEEVDDLANQHVSSCLNLNIMIITPNLLATAWMSLLRTFIASRKSNLLRTSKLTPSV